MEGLKDPRGQTFDIRKLGIQNQRIPRHKVELDSDEDDDDHHNHKMLDGDAEENDEERISTTVGE